MSLVGLVVVAVVLLAATAYGVIRRRRSGVLRSDVGGPRLTSAVVGSELGSRATLLQFSSAFCRPCVATRHVLDAVAQTVPGVRHIEVDAESHLDLVRQLDVMSTPTTLLLDEDGVIRRRATGVPHREAVLSALADVVDGAGR